MSNWEKIKEDLKIGIKEGMAAMKAGAEIVKGKTGELTEEGKRRYKLHNLRHEVKDEMAELGARVFALANERADFITDATANYNIDKIRKLEAEIAELEKIK
jgi:hypothetical protein